MPIILFLLSIATLATVASKAKAGPRPKGQGQTFTLDANVPEALRNQVLAALVGGTDPATLDAFATAIQMQYPLCADLLHAKAASLRAGTAVQPSMPSLPQPGPGPQPAPAPGPRQAPLPVDPGGPALDANMPPGIVAFVHILLATDNDPIHLLAVSNTMAAQYPVAAGLLASRAAVLNVQPQQPSPSPATPPANPPAPALGMPGLDPGMPPAVAQAVMGALIGENDPAKLQALATQLQGQYPMAASLLATKANTLLALVSPPQPAMPPAPAPAAPPLPMMPPTPLPAAPTVRPSGFPTSGMDANMPPALAQTVLSELANEADPVKLQSLSDHLAAQYPIAAGLLRARTEVILMTRPPAQIIPGVPSVPSPGVVMTTYSVQKNDFPWNIAAKFTGHGARWPELVAANPEKKKAPDGNFASLLPGEVLKLPVTWGARPPSAPQTPAAPNAALPQGPIPAPVPANSNATNGLDPSIPADVAAAVLTALQTANDPNQLRGFSTAIAQRGFPVAAGLLNAKANTLDAPPAPMVPVTYAPSGASTNPAPTGGTTYKVKAGDSPSKIAAALVHDGNRWKELVAANPTKKRAKDGNFASLQPGEVIQLPPSWPASSNGAAAPKGLVHMPQGGA